MQMCFHCQTPSVFRQLRMASGQVTIQWGEAEMVAELGRRPRPVLQEDKMNTEIYDSIISAI